MEELLHVNVQSAEGRGMQGDPMVAEAKPDSNAQSLGQSPRQKLGWHERVSAAAFLPSV